MNYKDDDIISNPHLNWALLTFRNSFCETLKHVDHYWLSERIAFICFVNVFSAAADVFCSILFQKVELDMLIGISNYSASYIAFISEKTCFFHCIRLWYALFVFSCVSCFWGRKIMTTSIHNIYAWWRHKLKYAFEFNIHSKYVSTHILFVIGVLCKSFIHFTLLCTCHSYVNAFYTGKFWINYSCIFSLFWKTVIE